MASWFRNLLGELWGDDSSGSGRNRFRDKGVPVDDNFLDGDDAKAREPMPEDDNIPGAVPFATPDSSNVVSFLYHEPSQTMFVKFNNRRGTDYDRLYRYPGISRDFFYEFVTYGSVGSLVWDKLRRTHHPFDRLN